MGCEGGSPQGPYDPQVHPPRPPLAAPALSRLLRKPSAWQPGGEACGPGRRRLPRTPSRARVIGRSQ